MSPKPNWTVGDFTADSVDAERLYTAARKEDVIIINDSGTYRAFGNSSEVDSDSDLGVVLNSAIGHVPRNGDIGLASDDFGMATKVDVDKSVKIAGAGTQEGRWNTSEGGTKITWTGGAEPAFEVGGVNGSIEGVSLESFYLEPDSSGDGTDGILIDGSTTREASRDAALDIGLTDVHIRDFGTHQLHVLGNVFDYQFTRCGFHGAGNLVEHESATSNGQNSPNYGEYYSCGFHSESQGSWGLHGTFRGNIIGGFLTTDNGVQMGYRSSLSGLHLESATNGSNTIGIETANGPNVVQPRTVGGFTDGIVHTDTSNGVVNVVGGEISGDDNSIRLEEEGLTVHNGALLNDGVVDNSAGGTNYDLRRLGYRWSENAFAIENSRLPIAFGVRGYENEIDHDDSTLDFILRTIDSGFSPTERLRITAEINQATAQWNSIDQNFDGGSIYGLREISSPSVSDLTDQEWAWDSTNGRWLYRDSGGTVHYFTPDGTL